METKTINLYEFNELDDTAKNKAVDDNRCINVDYWCWWDNVYDDAKMIGLDIMSFDLDRNDIDGRFVNSCAYDAANKIKVEHGFNTPTYKLADKFLKEYLLWIKDYAKADDDIDDLSDEFLKALLEEYRVILTNKFEWLTSDECVIDTIRANEYEFNKDGSLA
jgi:hypothetical protein